MREQHTDRQTDRHTYIHTDRQTEPNYYIDNDNDIWFSYRALPREDRYLAQNGFMIGMMVLNRI